MRVSVLGAISILLSVYTIINAYIRRGQFFSTCIYISHSNASILALFSTVIYIAYVFCKCVIKIFFGSLRAIEVEHLYERAWFAITELCLAMTIFRGEFNAKFAIFLTILLIIKIFHWLMQDRIDFMEQGINQSFLFHSRVISVIILLTFIDFVMFTWTLDYTLKFGISMIIVLGFEYTILLSKAITGALKYILHAIDIRRETPWENKSMYIFYIDLVREFFILISYVIFFGIIVHRYGLPLHLIRDLYITFRSFIQHCRDLIHYRKATKNMNERYPNATAEDLAENDNICIICREEMVISDDAHANSSDVPKKLRCGHIFHLRCLKSWLERQQSCPTCRCSLLETTPINNRHQNQNQQQPAQPAAAVPNVQQPAAANVQPGLTQPIQRNINTSTTNTPAPGNTSTTDQNIMASTSGLNLPTTSTTLPTTSSFIPNTFPTTGLSYQPVATLPITNNNVMTTSQMTYIRQSSDQTAIPVLLTPIANLASYGINDTSNVPSIDTLSDDKLNQIEGHLRENVVARIRKLSSINQQLTDIVGQLNQVLSEMPVSKTNATTSTPSIKTSEMATSTLVTKTATTATQATSPTLLNNANDSIKKSETTELSNNEIENHSSLNHTLGTSSSFNDSKGKSPITTTQADYENLNKEISSTLSSENTENIEKNENTKELEKENDHN